LNISKDLPLIHVDPVLVEQAIGQIIDNAAKYSTVSTGIIVAVNAEAKQLIITIKDDGHGLTADERLRLTERFFRGPRHVGKISGSGLGLWIANTFIISNEGRLEAVSPGIGQGTTVCVLLPVKPRVVEIGEMLQEE
jgi:K+-sensing histidine kinase KdpD